MKRFQAAITVAIATFCLNAGTSRAATFTVSQNNNPSDLISSLLGSITGLDSSTFQVQTIGNAQAFGTFQDDPFGLNSGIALSTGKVADLAGKNQCYASCADLKTDFPPIGTSGDRIQLRFDFLNNTADNLYFQYVFGSEELPEWAGSVFNDRFNLQLNGENLAYLSDGVTPVNITNLAQSSDLILNPPVTGFASDQTKLDGYSQPLLFTGNLKKGKTNTLLITLEDLGDGIYDSGVFLKAGTLSTVKPPDLSSGATNCRPIAIGGGVGLTRDSASGVPGRVDAGTPNCTKNEGGGAKVPEPSTTIGLLLVGLLSGGVFLKRRVNNRDRVLETLLEDV
jgi:hypothetical protein